MVDNLAFTKLDEGKRTHEYGIEEKKINKHINICINRVRSSACDNDHIKMKKDITNTRKMFTP